MQRLFSTFPGSWPGTGLLLLRGSISSSIIATHWGLISSVQSIGEASQQLLALAISTCLLLGLATPFAAGLQAVVSLAAVYAGGGDDGMSWFVAGVSASLTMIGPGAWSIDSLLFGRKRIAFGRR